MDLAAFDDEFLQSCEVNNLMGKVKVAGEIELDRYFPQSWPGRVRISLRDGSSHAREIIIPKGEKENPMSAQEVEEKFLSLAAPVLGDATARSVIGAVQGLADRDSLSELLTLLRV
jgi:2-methylcitrate dehydratase PrpD